MTITCNNCGYDANPDGTEYCEACGSELITVSSATSSTSMNIDNFPTLDVGGNAGKSIPESSPAPFTTTPPTENNPAPFTATPSSPPMSAPAMSLGIMGMAKLVAKQVGYPQSEFAISASQPVIIGRFDDTTGPVDIDLVGFPDDDTISRNHAEIYFESNQWKIKPISTTNGTFIKKFGESRFGGKIITPEVINNGDEIAFAKIRFIFQTS